MSEESTHTVVRAVTLPVAVPLGADPAGGPWTWGTFDAALLPAFRLSTDLANWCVRRLFVLDDPASARTPDAVKKWYGYKDAGEAFPAIAGWAGAMASLNIVTRTVQRKYIQERFRVMVRHESNLLTYRFPQPFPVHNANWKTDYADGGFPTVRLALPGVGQVELRLKRRADFGRQLAMFKALHEGTAKKGEAALYRDRKGVLLLKLVGHFPRTRGLNALPPSADPMPTLPDAEVGGRVTPEALAAEMPEGAGSAGETPSLVRGVGVQDRGNVCFLHTDPNALLVAEINGRSVTVTNGDHLKRAHAVIRETADRHRRFLQRVSEDKKREVRMDRGQRDNLNKKVADRCSKQHARIDTAVKQIAAQVARFLERQRVGLVAYDDAVKTFLPDGFQWFALETRLKQLFEGEMGGEWVSERFMHLNTDEERQEWLKRARHTATAGTRAVAHKRRSGSHPKVTPATNSTGSPSRPPTSKRKSARP